MPELPGGGSSGRRSGRLRRQLVDHAVVDHEGKQRQIVGGHDALAGLLRADAHIAVVVDFDERAVHVAAVDGAGDVETLRIAGDGDGAGDLGRNRLAASELVH